jgi:hypothetical protein
MEIRGRDRAAAIERLESVLCARDNEYLYIGYATQMRAELPRSALSRDHALVSAILPMVGHPPRVCSCTPSHIRVRPTDHLGGATRHEVAAGDLHQIDAGCGRAPLTMRGRVRRLLPLAADCH